MSGGALDGVTGAAFCRRYADQVDEWLAGLLATAVPGAPEGIALVALGGYGRAELAPGSDIDVMLLHSGSRGVSRQTAESAGRLWYPVWEAGLRLGHSVSSLKEALRLGAEDLDTATALLSARHIGGDASLTTALAAGAREQWERRSRPWLTQLAGGVAERHRRFGEVAFCLEPDLKEGRGGLRDVHALHWAEAAHRVLLEVDEPGLDAAYGILLDARVELQRLTGSATNVLALQEQDAVAAALGDPSASALMGRLAEAARTIAWTSDDAWRRVASALQGQSGRRSAQPRTLAPGILHTGGPAGEVALGPGAPLDDPLFVLRVAQAAAAEGAAIERASLETLAEQAPALGDPWPAGARELFVALLAEGERAIRVIEALDQRGLWAGILPEWARVRALPPQSAYHRFTVDRHLLETVALAAPRTGQVPRPDLLLVAALLHDVGKGSGDDHSSAGAALVRGIGARMGFPPGDIDVLAQAVELHLLLPEVATGRDIDDPATIQRVAGAVGTTDLLSLLAALTEADSLATGPSAWSPWKAGLVGCLVERAGACLTGIGEIDDPCEGAGEPFPSPRQLQRLAAGGQLIEARGHVLTVMDDDRPGMFSRVAGVLAMHGLDVLAAAAYSSDDGRALSEFRVADPVYGELPWTRVTDDLRRALGGGLAVQARVVARARTYARTRPKSRVPVEPSVAVDNEASEAATVIDVQAPDAIGTLYRITRALADFDLDIRRARARTQGSAVVDSFYVRDRAGKKITDTAHLAELERAILHVLAE
jgi:[protein-PII] uridylyltransferase